MGYVSTISTGAGFLPSTVFLYGLVDNGFQYKTIVSIETLWSYKTPAHHPVSWPQGTQASPGAMVVQRGNNKDPGRSLFLS